MKKYFKNKIIKENPVTFKDNKMSQQNSIQLSSSRTRRAYCCSFCGEQGHNYITCTSTWFADFESLCATRANSLGTRTLFKEWLWDIYSDDISLLFMFCVRKFRVSRVNLNERICLDLLTDYTFATYFNNNLELEIVRLLTELQNLRESEPMQNVFNAFGSEEMFAAQTTGLRMSGSFRKLNIKLSVESKKAEGTACECSICYDEIKSRNFVKLNCNHEFCKDCMIKTLETRTTNAPCCALCRCEIKNIQTKTEKIRENFNKFII
jgi:hypothetical protein